MWLVWLFLLVVIVPVLFILKEYVEQVLRFFKWAGWFQLIFAPLLAEMTVAVQDFPSELVLLEDLARTVFCAGYCVLGAIAVASSNLFLWAAGKSEPLPIDLDPTTENEPEDLDALDELGSIERAALKALDRDRAAGLTDRDRTIENEPEDSDALFGLDRQGQITLFIFAFLVFSFFLSMLIGYLSG